MAILNGSCEHYSLELKKRRKDWAAVKLTPARYNEIVNQSIREAPMSMWYRDIDTSLTTIADTRRYSLAALTDITRADQVQRVWMEGSDDHYYRLGRWKVEDDAGTLTLVLDETPTADLTIQLEYIVPWAAISCSSTATAVTALDPDWLVAKGMTLVFLEADPQDDDPRWVSEQLQAWDMKRQAREAEIRRRRPADKVRTQVWP